MLAPMVRRADPAPVTDVLERIDAAAEGGPVLDTVPTGFPSLDRLLGGGARLGDLLVLGGDVGAGKSALALAIALRAAQSGRRTAFLTGEMTVERVVERILAIEGRAAVNDLRRGTAGEEARVGVGTAAMRLRDHAPLLQVIPEGGAEGVRRLVPRLDAELLVVDGLQSLATGARPLDEELHAAARSLKSIALAHSLAVLVTAHLPHHAPRPDARPVLDDFGALGGVKQHADVVLGLYREEMYAPGLGVEGATELRVLKNRSGETGWADLYFYRKWMRFEDMLDPDR